MVLKSYLKNTTPKLSRTEWKKRVIECFKRDNYTCRNPKCKRVYAFDDHALTPHHINNRSQVHDDSLKNLVSLCTFPCHRKVTDKLIPNDFVNEDN